MDEGLLSCPPKRGQVQVSWAMPQPARAARSPAARLVVMVRVASRVDLSSARRMVSNPKVLTVVDPPQNPVPAIAASCAVPRPSPTVPRMIPRSRDPVTLMVKMPQGETLSRAPWIFWWSSQRLGA